MSGFCRELLHLRSITDSWHGATRFWGLLWLLFIFPSNLQHLPSSREFSLAVLFIWEGKKASDLLAYHLSFPSNKIKLLFLSVTPNIGSSWLNDFTCLNSVVGGFLIIAGLYLVTWASYRDKQANLGMVLQVVRSSEPLVHKDASINRMPFHRGHIFSGAAVLPKSRD